MGLQLHWKRDCDTGFFLRILRNFQEHLFYRTPLGDCFWIQLTRSWRRSLSYSNQSIDLLGKSMNWFIYDRDLRYERVKWVSFLTHIRPILLLYRNQSINVRLYEYHINKQPPVFRKFHRKTPVLESLYDKVARVLLKLTLIHDPATLLKKRLWHRCFPVNFAKFLGTIFYRTPTGGCFCELPAGNYMIKVKDAVVLVPLLLTLNIFHTFW